MKIVKSIIFAAVVAVAVSSTISAQDSDSVAQTVVQNPDGTYTVIEYPLGKEVVVNLMPGAKVKGARGTAKVLRADDGTKIILDLNSMSGDAASVYAYAVDPEGIPTLLGPVSLKQGTGSAEFMTSMNQFMLVLSPTEGLKAVDPATEVYFRSEAPKGFAVVPTRRNTDTKAVATSSTVTSAYNVPLLGVPGFKEKTTEIRIDFEGALSGLKGKAYIDPGAAGTTQVKMRFDDMKLAPKDKRFVLWASSADGSYTKLGQVINTGERQESEIRSETALKDFGLFVTVEDSDVMQPTSTLYSPFRKL